MKDYKGISRREKMKKYIIAVLIIFAVSTIAVAGQRIPWICKRYITECPPPIVCPPPTVCPEPVGVKPTVDSVFTSTKTTYETISWMTSVGIGNNKNNPNIILWWDWNYSTEYNMGKLKAMTQLYRSMNKPFVVDIGWVSPINTSTLTEVISSIEQRINEHDKQGTLVHDNAVNIYIWEIDIYSIYANGTHFENNLVGARTVVEYAKKLHPNRVINIFLSPYFNGIEYVNTKAAMDRYGYMLEAITNNDPSVRVFSALQDGMGCAGHPAYGEEYYWRQPGGQSFDLMVSVIQDHYNLTNTSKGIFTRVNNELFEYDKGLKDWVYGPSDRVKKQLAGTYKYSYGGSGPSFAVGEKLMGDFYNVEDFKSWYENYMR